MRKQRLCGQTHTGKRLLPVFLTLVEVAVTTQGGEYHQQAHYTGFLDKTADELEPGTKLDFVDESKWRWELLLGGDKRTVSTVGAPYTL